MYLCDPLALGNLSDGQIHVLLDLAFLYQLFVTFLEPLFLLHEHLEFFLLVRDLLYLVEVGDKLVVDVIDLELNLLHSKDKLNARLSVKTEADVDNFEVIELIGFLSRYAVDREYLREMQPCFHLN